MVILKNMNERERIMVGSAVIISLLTFIWIGVYEPMTERRVSLQRKIEAKKGELMEVTALADRYTAAKAVFTSLDQRLSSGKAGGSLLSSLEVMAKNSGLSGSVTSMSPTPSMEVEGYRESGVELRLGNVSLSSLVSLLKAVRSAPGYIRVKRIAIKTNYENPEYLEVALTVADYERI